MRWSTPVRRESQIDRYLHVHDRLDGTTSVAPLNPRRSLISSTTNAGDRESYAHSTPYLARNQHPPNGFGVYTDTPRSIHSLTGLSLSSGYPAHMASASPQSGFEGSQNECANFPWPSLEVLSDIECEGQAVTPEIHAKVEKGFFKSTVDQKWTCYRRNYFSVACHFTIHPNVYNGRMWLKRNNTREQIQAMGMRLSAAVDGPGGKNIELVQHTPKRDNGPKSKIEVIKVSPTSSSGRGEHSISPNGIYQVQMSAFHATGQVLGPYLPFQQSNESDAPSSSSPQSSQAYQYGAGGSHLGVPGQTTTHTFERVQFKQATANNGKRRASQQYFHLMVELFADVRKDGKEQPVWVKVAHKLSDKIVVRGRSPSHYQNEGQHNQGGRNGGAGGGGGYSTSTGVAYGGLNTGGFRSSASAYGGTIGNSGGYRANQYGHQNSSGDDASSPESVDDRAMESDHPIDTVMSDADRAGVQDYEGYQYYPHPIYEEVQQHLLPLPKIETGARYSTEPRQYAVKAEYADAAPGTHWPIGGVGRFQGVDSSRGYYPDLSAGAPGFP